MTSLDVPSPIDLKDPQTARQWAAQALQRRPARPVFFEAHAQALRHRIPGRCRVLELASGPGFLAQHVLNALPDLQMVLLDNSSAMHELARERLAALAARAEFVLRDMGQADALSGLGTIDAVLTHQAVHELRHKRHALGLHQRVRALLGGRGVYLVCDHFCGPGGQPNDQLYMTVDEQAQALRDAGFAHVQLIHQEQGLVLHAASDA
ncbi:MAG: class I SAM-dependent methyltransferase [Ideonella sp.]|nr:class I SAM-dependent methyltransferase [Ideonella sp.]